MKLESAAMKGKDALKLEPIIEDNVLDTTQMLFEVYQNRGKHSREDLAYSVHAYLAEGFASLAIEKAAENGIKTIGFTGGVACNEIIASALRKLVESANMRFLLHSAVPPGDGGISFGQAVVGGFFHV